MNKKEKHALLWLSALCLLVSCGDAGNERKDTAAMTDAGTDTVSETQGETAIPFNSLPDGLDYRGQTVTVLGWEHYEDIEFTAEAEVGEIVSDAVFVRNRNVSECLNVTLEFSETNGRSGDATWMNQIRNSNKAGDYAYDIVAGHSQNIGTLAKGGELYNLLSCEYLDFTQPWWRTELTERAVIQNQLYFATGDISPSSIARTQGVFFNKIILNDFDLEDPYQLVVDGTWTTEKMMSMTKGIYQDLNSDGKKDEAGDRFGFAMDTV